MPLLIAPFVTLPTIGASTGLTSPSGQQAFYQKAATGAHGQQQTQQAKKQQPVSSEDEEEENGTSDTDGLETTVRRKGSESTVASTTAAKSTSLTANVKKSAVSPRTGPGALSSQVSGEKHSSAGVKTSEAGEVETSECRSSSMSSKRDDKLTENATSRPGQTNANGEATTSAENSSDGRSSSSPAVLSVPPNAIQLQHLNLVNGTKSPPILPGNYLDIHPGS